MRSFTDMWYDPVARKKILIFGGGGLVFIIVLIIIIVVATSGSKAQHFDGRQVLEEVPLIDGHNNFPNNLFLIEDNKLATFDFNNITLTKNEKWKNYTSSHTDLARLKLGRVHGQFWATYADCSASNNKDAVARTMEQVDVIKRLTDKYEDLNFVTTADGIMQAFWDGKVASLIGVSGGHSIDSRLAVLRRYYDLGVRYMTITDDCDTPWATSRVTANDTGLTAFGQKVILEMNRLGMIVDISHASPKLMNDVLNITKAPVIFSHSAAAAKTVNTMNVNDDVLIKLKDNQGIIMINFGSELVRTNVSENATVGIDDVIAHLDHIKNLTDSKLVGIGANYDGATSLPEELGDVSTYPELFDALAISKGEHVGWNREELRNLAGDNFIRVMRAVEKFRDDNINNEKDPILTQEDLILPGDLTEADSVCRSPAVNP